MRKKKKPSVEGNGENKQSSDRWMLTYLDMITLLMVLFVMMYAISNVDASKFKALAEQLGIAFGAGKSIVEDGGAGINTDYLADLEIVPTPTPTSSSGSGEGDAAAAQEDILNKINALIQQSGLNSTVSVHREERGVVVRLEEVLLFPSGSAVINDSAKDILNRIADVIKSVNNYIKVEGSADNVPIQNGQFPSNWELAAQRAINVTKLLVEDGVDPTRTSVTSYGEYRPVVTNDNEENKKQNRRVDIVFINTDLNQYELQTEVSN